MYSPFSLEKRFVATQMPEKTIILIKALKISLLCGQQKLNIYHNYLLNYTAFNTTASAKLARQSKPNRVKAILLKKQHVVNHVEWR